MGIIVVTNPPNANTTGDGSCCCGGVSCCGGTIPATLYGTMTSTCAAYDGLTFTMTYDAALGVWRGSSGTPGECGVVVEAACINNELRCSFTIGQETITAAATTETVSCSPISASRTEIAAWNLLNGTTCCEGTTTLTVTT